MPILCHAEKPSLKLVFHIAAAVQDTPDFHYIADYNIEKGVVSHIDAIIGVPPLPVGMKGLKGFCAGASLLYRALHLVNQTISRYRIL